MSRQSTLPPELKAQWVAALRSGEYKQGHGELRTNGGTRYCCLGVLTDLHPEFATPTGDDDDGYRYPDGNGFFNDVLSVDLAHAYFGGVQDPGVPLSAVPKEARKIAGYALDYYADDATVKLSTLNDAGVPFDAIAIAIEGGL